MAKSLSGADITIVRGGVVHTLKNDGGDNYDGEDAITGQDGSGDPIWDNDDDTWI